MTARRDSSCFGLLCVFAFSCPGKDAPKMLLKGLRCTRAGCRDEDTFSQGRSRAGLEQTGMLGPGSSAPQLLCPGSVGGIGRDPPHVPSDTGSPFSWPGVTIPRPVSHSSFGCRLPGLEGLRGGAGVGAAGSWPEGCWSQPGHTRTCGTGDGLMGTRISRFGGTRAAREPQGPHPGPV